MALSFGFCKAFLDVYQNKKYMFTQEEIIIDVTKKTKQSLDVLLFYQSMTHSNARVFAKHEYFNMKL